MKIKEKKKTEFADLYELGAFSKVVATKNQDSGRWALFGLNTESGSAVFVQKARGGIREWSGLDYLSDFCSALGIARWEVHNRNAQN